ncbi:hypothetical protein LguiA_002151 [Lonicera macranthoides]
MGSQFLEIDTFEIAYGGKNKNITKDIAKAKFDEMVAKKNVYMKELAKDYHEDTPLNEIIVPNKDIGVNIVTNVLGFNTGKEFHGLGASQVHDLKGSSLRARQLADQLATERATRQAVGERLNAADAAREKTQQRLEFFMQSWEQTIQQLAQQLPGFLPPPMIPHTTDFDQRVREAEDDVNA